jgi:hypothetical protein
MFRPKKKLPPDPQQVMRLKTLYGIAQANCSYFREIGRSKMDEDKSVEVLNEIKEELNALEKPEETPIPKPVMVQPTNPNVKVEGTTVVEDGVEVAEVITTFMPTVGKCRSFQAIGAPQNAEAEEEE